MYSLPRSVPPYGSVVVCVCARVGPSLPDRRDAEIKRTIAPVGAESAFWNAHFAARRDRMGRLTPASPHKLLEFIWRQTCPSPSYVGKPGGEGENMNWGQIEGKWKRFTGSARERWGKLTDNDWETIAGKKDQLVGRIQERYGVARAEAEKQADERSLAQKGSERGKVRRHPLVEPPSTDTLASHPLTARRWRQRGECGPRGHMRSALLLTLISALGLPLCADRIQPE